MQISIIAKSHYGKQNGGRIDYCGSRPIEQAHALLEQREQTYKVVSVNSTLSADQKHLHVKEYLALSLADAIVIAARLEIQSKEVAEEVVAIEPVYPDEELEFLQADQELRARIQIPVKATVLNIEHNGQG